MLGQPDHSTPYLHYQYCPTCGQKYSRQASVNAFRCGRCGLTFYRNSKPTASTLIIKNGRVLLGKRTIEPEKGKWDVIGGFLEYNEDPRDGAIREAKEETGLDVDAYELLGFFMDVYGPDKDSTLNICYLAKVVGGVEQPGDDIAELQWFRPDEIPPVIAFKNGRAMLDSWLKKLGE